eukprot:SAG11_NODE_1972_length_3980_cov_6.425921_1_plen_436_part_00
MLLAALIGAAASTTPARAASSPTWKRQPCGATPGGVPGGADLVTRWGATVDPATAQPLPEYPRPQMARSSSWLNMNGMWEWEPAAGINATAATPPPFGRKLARAILVPFPAESCLSGIGESHPYQWYRHAFDGAKAFAGSRAVLHFGAVDWHAKVYLNKRLLGNHSGGYDGFSFELAPGVVIDGENEVIVFVYDPSEHGSQPFGKQRAASISAPGTDGEKYTPTSGIWQTVWLEQVGSTYISDLEISANLSAVTVLVSSLTSALDRHKSLLVSAFVESAPGQTIATAHAYARSGAKTRFSIAIPTPQLWSPLSPFLYNMTISISAEQPITSDGGLEAAPVVIDTVRAYFGMRTVALGDSPSGTKTLLLNGKAFFASGWLDQSWWPDGQYTAPTDEALAFDVQAVKTFGMNMVVSRCRRCHLFILPFCFCCGCGCG